MWVSTHLQKLLDNLGICIFSKLYKPAEIFTSLGTLRVEGYLALLGTLSYNKDDCNKRELYFLKGSLVIWELYTPKVHF